MPSKSDANGWTLTDAAVQFWEMRVDSFDHLVLRMF